MSTVIPTTRSKFNILPIAALIVILLTGWMFYNFTKPHLVSPPAITISQNVLEQKYGLRVDLIAVTAAGGFIDVRIKIVDREKAKLLLSDRKNFPSLLVHDMIVLNASQDTKSQEIRFNDNGTMFILYVNSENLIKPGTPVSILFGNVALEPINSK